MKKGIVFFILGSFSLYAQSDISNLKLYKNYPLCSDIIKVYKQNSSDESQKAETISADKAKNLAQQYFAADTAITYALMSHFQKFILLENSIIEDAQYKMNENLAGTYYVLSSTLAVIPNDSNYQKDCWAKMNSYSRVNLSYGAALYKVRYRVNDETQKLEVTPGTQLYTYNDKPCDEEQISCSWVSAAILDSGNMALYGKDSLNIEIESIEPSSVEAKNIWNKPSSKKMFNLNTETYSYYVGRENSRVLVYHRP